MLKIYDKIDMIVTDNDNNRYERLHIVVGYLYAKNPQLINMINKIEDHEGYLIIDWKSKPSTVVIKDCQNIWDSFLCNECGENIEHYVNGVEIQP